MKYKEARMWMLASGSRHSSPEKFQFRFCALHFVVAHIYDLYILDLIQTIMLSFVLELKLYHKINVRFFRGDNLMASFQIHIPHHRLP